MALEEIELNLGEVVMPERVATLIAEADRRLDHLFATNRNRRVPRFLPSDPALLFTALADLTRRNIPPGRVFCEWGSGFGVAACLASLLGYTAYGLEIEDDLVTLAQDLARDLDIEVTNLCTSYFPDGYGSYPAHGGAELMVPEPPSRWEAATHQVAAYDGMAHEIEEIDLFYIYPWPGEQELMHNLFDAIATEGAILVAYYGDQDLSAYRKVFGDDEWGERPS